MKNINYLGFLTIIVFVTSTFAITYDQERTGNVGSIWVSNAGGVGNCNNNSIIIKIDGYDFWIEADSIAGKEALAIALMARSIGANVSITYTNDASMQNCGNYKHIGRIILLPN